MAQGNVARVKNRWKEYFYLGFYTLGVIKLAENYQEWRRALKQLAEKHSLQPKTPMLQRLLELAENPPLPIKNLNPSRYFYPVPG